MSAPLPLSPALDPCGLSPAQQALLQAHWALLAVWNARTNLTAIHSPEQAVWLHYRDSLEGLRWLQGPSLVDFGSGAGFPGLVLAIARPAVEVTLVEPRRLRVAFLQACVAALGLANVQVFQGKLGSRPPRRHAQAVTRATFADPGDFLAAAPWLLPGGSLIAWRAVDAVANPQQSQRHIYTLPAPGGPRRRCLSLQTFPDAP